MDTIRVLRIYEFVGPRDTVEKQVAGSIQGEHTFGGSDGRVTIRAATIGTYPEILQPSPVSTLEISPLDLPG